MEGKRERKNRWGMYVYRGCNVSRVYCPQSMPINYMYTLVNGNTCRTVPIWLFTSERTSLSCMWRLREITSNEWIRRVSLLLPVTPFGPWMFGPAYFGARSSRLVVSTARHTLGAEHRPTSRSQHSICQTVLRSWCSMVLKVPTDTMHVPSSAT